MLEIIALNIMLNRFTNVQSRERNWTVYGKFVSVKMMFYLILLVTVSFYLAPTTAEYSDELYVVEDPSTNELTCISENDDAALVWNYDLGTNESTDSFNHFKPVKPIYEKLPWCAVWRSNECLATWKTQSNQNFDLVNSFDEPTGPIVDYRWEGLAESKGIKSKCFFSVRFAIDYQGFGSMKVFSIRATDDVPIRLCGRQSSRCIVITIAVTGNYSAIHDCDNNVVRNSAITQQKWYQNCRELDKFKHESGVLHAHEWRTFRVQFTLDFDKQITKVFSDTEKEAFLTGLVEGWSQGFGIVFESAPEALIKLHDYNYIQLSSSPELQTTEQFSWNDANFCVDMLVSLCPKCQMYVSLMEIGSSEKLAKWHIRGDEHFGSPEMKIWQSIKLHTTLNSIHSMELTMNLEIIPSVYTQWFERWWAFDNFRSCEKNDEIRESTIQLPSSNLGNVGHNIKCQKLFHGKIVSVDSSERKPFWNIIQLKEYIRQRKNSNSSDGSTFGDVDHSPIEDHSQIWLVLIVPIVVICSLSLFVWYWRYRKIRIKERQSQDVPSDFPGRIPANLSSQPNYARDDLMDPVNETIPENPREQTSDPSNISLDPPYMIPINPNGRPGHARDVSMVPAHTALPNNLQKQTSHSQNLPLAPIYDSISETSEVQTNHTPDFPSNPLYEYVNIPDNSKERTRHLQNVPDAPVYHNILETLGEQTNNLQDAPLEPEYLTILPSEPKLTKQQVSM